MSELEFLGALHVELLRHRELHPEHPDHELFQTSTVEALLGGAFGGDVTLREVLEHGDLGLGTLDGLDGELIVLDGEAWKAELDGTLTRPSLSSTTPYAVVVPFSPGAPMTLQGPFADTELEAHLGRRLSSAERPTAIRIDGRFQTVHVRSVPKQQPPYPPLAEAIAQQHVSELANVSGTMMGFCFPDALDGIEMVGSHLHFADEQRTRGGHVLSYTSSCRPRSRPRITVQRSTRTRSGDWRPTAELGRPQRPRAPERPPPAYALARGGHAGYIPTDDVAREHRVAGRGFAGRGPCPWRSTGAGYGHV